MSPTTIRELRDKSPFRRFGVHLADGRTLEVVTPDHIMISPTNDEFALYEHDGTLNIIDAKLVTSITRAPKRRGRPSPE